MRVSWFVNPAMRMWQDAFVDKSVRRVCDMSKTEHRELFAEHQWTNHCQLTAATTALNPKLTHIVMSVHVPYLLVYLHERQSLLFASSLFSAVARELEEFYALFCYGIAMWRWRKSRGGSGIDHSLTRNSITAAIVIGSFSMAITVFKFVDVVFLVQGVFWVSITNVTKSWFDSRQ